MKNAKIKKTAVLTLFLGLTGLLTFTFLPYPMQNRNITFIPIPEEKKSEMPADLPTYLEREYLLSLSFPKWIWLGDMQYVILYIQPDDNFLIERNDHISQYSTNLEARLELNSMDIYPGNMMFQVLQIEKPAQFLWKVKPDNSGGSTGKLWLYIVINQNEQGLEWKIPVFALPIKISIRSWMGWTLPIVRGLIVAGLAFMIVLWIILTRPSLNK